MDVEKRIKARLPEVLEAADMDTLTERAIRNALAAELGVDISPHKTLIKSIIEDFLEAKAEEPEEAAAAPVGGKRKAGAAPASQPTKARKADVGEGSYVLELTAGKRVTVQLFKGKLTVDLREYYEDKSTGDMKPGPKGLALSFDQWMTLKPQLGALAEATRNGEEAGPVQLSSDRRAFVQAFKGRYSLHVREMYEKDGETLPGKKGVVLDAAGAEQLAAAAEDITEAARRRGGKLAEPAAAAPAAAAAAAGPSGARAAGDAPSGAKKATQALENVRPASGGDGAEDCVELGGDKRASISVFKGKKGIDVREYYSKDGTMAPGKKGITLTLEQYRLLAQNADAISNAAGSHDTKYGLDMGSKRKVTLSEFKGKLYVGIREFYEKDGELKPGAKGLNMTVEQWKKLAEGIPRLDAALESA